VLPASRQSVGNRTRFRTRSVYLHLMASGSARCRWMSPDEGAPRPGGAARWGRSALSGSRLVRGRGPIPIWPSVSACRSGLPRGKPASDWGVGLTNRAVTTARRARINGAIVIATSRLQSRAHNLRSRRQADRRLRQTPAPSVAQNLGLLGLADLDVNPPYSIHCSHPSPDL